MSVLPETMKAVVAHGPEDYRVEEVAVPKAGPGKLSSKSKLVVFVVVI